MKIIFTLCSNNYLAQAQTLGDSIKQTNPNYQFYIGLTDKLSPEIDYNKEITHTIVPVAEIGILDFDNLWKKYSIIEFNTCVKPFYFQYFINHFKEIEYLFYLDPDTFVYGDLQIIEQEFGENGNVLLTPHITKPINLDDKTPNEHLFLNFGLYNLGFFGLKDPKQSDKLLDWWKERTYHLGYNNTSNGLFVDQLWVNLVPIFFNNTTISKHPGLNMAPWNLHERTLTEINNTYTVNSKYPLVFYHFSNYKHKNSTVISSYFSRHNFESAGDLKKIYKNYHLLLLDNGIEKLGKIKCQYMAMRETHLYDEQQRVRNSSLEKMIKYHLKKIVSKKAINIINAVRH